MNNIISKIKKNFINSYLETMSDNEFPSKWKPGHGRYPSPFGVCQGHTYPILNAITKIVSPSRCLETGSWAYRSAYSISLAMKENNGTIDTFDICVGGFSGPQGNTFLGMQETLKNDPRGKAIIPHFWRPHHTTYDKWKNESENIIHKDFRNMTNDEIFKENAKYLKSIAPKKGYDLISIDADHSFDGARFDWEYAHLVSHENTVILIDDIYTHCHTEVKRFYESLDVESYNFYDFNMSHPEIFVNVAVCLPDKKLLNKLRDYEI